jgi:hypothetical protein
VSEWERGKSQINKDYRRVLVALIKVLYQSGGLKSTTEADTLLLSGNYRPLDEDEKMSIFPNDAPKRVPAGGAYWAATLISAEQWVSRAGDLLRRQVDEHEPDSSSRSHFLGMLDIFFSQWSFERTLKLLAWLGLWVAEQRILFPMLYWPFADQAQAWKVMVWYIGGSFALPALVAVLTDTDKDTFWRQQSLAGRPILRLYTYVGAFMGFNIGYLMVFAVTLIGYYLGIAAAPQWLVNLGAAWPLVMDIAPPGSAPSTNGRVW